MVEPTKPISHSPRKIGEKTVMSKKWPADIQGSLVMTTSPATSLPSKCLASASPAAASELMWPGVPVLAWATMRPRASNRPLARSPASRTIGLKAMRCSALACSETMLIRFDQRISSVIPSTSDTPFGDDAAQGIDLGDPFWRDHDRRFALLDDRRTRQGLAGGKARAVIDRRRPQLRPQQDRAMCLRLARLARQRLGIAGADIRAADGQAP